MTDPIFRSALDGWRPAVRRRVTVVVALTAVIFLVAVPFDSYRSWGQMILAAACIGWGTMALLPLISKRFARRWLEDSTPDDMTYRLLLTSVILVGCGLALLVVVYL